VSRASYQIIDEPARSGISNWAVNPVFPLLAVMLAGAVPGYAFGVVNSFAIGSATRRKEILWSIAGVVGLAALVFAGALLANQGLLSSRLGPYYGISLLVWRLYAGYRIYMSQSMAFELHEYFGGPVRNGLIPLLALAFLTPQIPWPAPFDRLADIWF